MDKLPNPFMTGFDETWLMEVLADELDRALSQDDLMPIVEVLQEHMR